MPDIYHHCLQCGAPIDERGIFSRDAGLQEAQVSFERAQAARQRARGVLWRLRDGIENGRIIMLKEVLRLIEVFEINEASLNVSRYSAEEPDGA